MASGILFLRLVLGLIVVAHGLQKLSGSFGGHGLRTTAGFFSNLNFRSPQVVAVAVGLTELSGGLLLAAGLVTPLAAFGIATVILASIATVHWRNGFWNSGGGYEFNLLLWAAVIALAATGPGRYSLDALIGWADSLSGPWWGLGVAGASVLGSALALKVGRHPARPPAASVTENAAPSQVPREREASVSSADNGTWAIASGAAASDGPGWVLGRPAGQLGQACSPIEIQVGGASEGNDLIDCLWRHGLPATLVETGGRWGVEVRSPRDESRRLMLDVVAALESWLFECARPGLLLRVGDRNYTMRPHFSR